jgi:hypothetical protein
MTLDAIINLETIKHISSGGGGYPYIWPTRVWIDSSGSFSGLGNRDPRLILGSGLSAGESASIPISLGQLRSRFDETTMKRALILAVALWSAKESPNNAVIAGCNSFHNSISDRLSNHIGGLISWDNLSEQERAQFVDIIKSEVRTDVESAIKNSLSTYQKIQIEIGLITMDNFIEAAFIVFDRSVLKRPEPPEASSSSVPIILRFRDQYEVEGHLVVTYVRTDRCQLQVDAVHSAESYVRSLEEQIKDLRQNPDNLPPRVVRDLIKKIQTEELPQARDALEKAKLALQDCRDFQPVLGGHGFDPKGPGL